MILHRCGKNVGQWLDSLIVPLERWRFFVFSWIHEIKWTRFYRFIPRWSDTDKTSSLRNNAFPTESLLGMRFRKGNISASLNIQLGQLARHNPQKVAADLCKFNAKSVHLSGASVVQWVGKNINLRRERNFSKHREIGDRCIFSARPIYENRLFYTIK